MHQAFSWLTTSELIVDDITVLMQKYFNASTSLSFVKVRPPNISDSAFPSIGLVVSEEQLDIARASGCISWFNSNSITVLNST